MKQILLTLLAAAGILAGCGNEGRRLARTICEDALIDQVDSMAKALAATGFNAGSVYKEVWIRDFNTFVELSLEVLPQAEVRGVLDTFADFQAEDGNIPDAFVEVATADNLGYKYRFCEARPGMAAHKNTVETDQESSYVQAVAQYIDVTGDVDYLKALVPKGSRVVRVTSERGFLRALPKATHAVVWSFKPEWFAAATCRL